MKCTNGFITSFLIFTIGSIPGLASETSNSSIGVNIETDLSYLQQLGQTKFKSNPISLDVKLYENGDVFIDKLNFSTVRYKEKFDNGNVEVKADILGFYREEIQSQIGSEQGVRYVDLEVARVIKLNEHDDITYRIEGFLKVDRDNHITMSDENAFNVENHLNKDYRSGSFNPRYGVGLRANYDMGDGEASVRATFMNTSDSYQNDEIEDQTYNFSKKEKKVELSYRPDKKKCHTYKAGVKIVDIDQGISGFQNDIKNTEYYAQYSCKFDLWPIFFPKTNKGSLIRY